MTLHEELKKLMFETGLRSSGDARDFSLALEAILSRHPAPDPDAILAPFERLRVDGKSELARSLKGKSDEFKCGVYQAVGFFNHHLRQAITEARGLMEGKKEMEKTNED